MAHKQKIPSKSQKKATSRVESKTGNVEQIREILFGGHIRAFDERFDLVESRLVKEAATLRKALEERVLEVERMLEKYRGEAGDQFDAASSERDLALNKIELALASVRMDTDARVAKLEDGLDSLRKVVRSELKAARKDITTTLNQAVLAQDKRTDKLDQNKVDRKELAEFLKLIAEKLQASEASQRK